MIANYRTRLLTFFLVLLTGLLCTAQPSPSPLEKARQSHVDGNVPAASDFQDFLQRDVKKYLDCEEVEIEMLRKRPTQSGVSFPKYYLWVVGKRAGDDLVRGAMRVAAVEKKQFEVLQFLSDERIRKDPGSVARVFPTALVSEIRRRAEAGE